MRQLAWLNTAPDPPKSKRPGTVPQEQKQPIRIHRMKTDKVPIELPANPLPHLIDWLMEIGPLGTGGMGPVPVSWAEIEVWQRVSAIELRPWEARTIRRLSREFLDQMTKSKEPSCPAPYSTGAANAASVDAQFKKMFAHFSKAKERKR